MFIFSRFRLVLQLWFYNHLYLSAILLPAYAFGAVLLGTFVANTYSGLGIVIALSPVILLPVSGVGLLNGFLLYASSCYEKAFFQSVLGESAPLDAEVKLMRLIGRRQNLIFGMMVFSMLAALVLSKNYI